MRLNYSLMLVVFMGLAAQGLACNCVVDSSPKAALQRATVVFHGRVSEVQRLDVLEAPDPRTGQLRRWIPEKDARSVATFVVDGFWKGPVKLSIKVISVARPSWSCSEYEFLPGREYMVYATLVRDRFKGEDIYTSEPCEPTEQGGIELGIDALGKAQAPKKD